ncbi:MAG: PatB family C-S lyase, partial [Prevotellaceae bacterium]|nr:PatB family C-S lyase [Prevotellaceae bacterium]
MDFATPDFILDVIKRRFEHPILGYTERNEEWYQAIIEWQKNRFGWNIKHDWVNFVPGIVPGIAFSIQCFTKPGDKILIQTPVYSPYINVPKNNKRIVVESPLIINDENKLEIDFDDFEQKAKECKLFLLCHPHNPGGKVWTIEELQKMAEICRRTGTIVVSDEIHADLTLKPFKHHPFASVSEDAAQNSVTFASPSKAFNMAGLTSSYSIIPNDNLRKSFHEYMENNELNMGHLLSFISVTAAYTHGTDWLDECLTYIQTNINILKESLKEMPKLDMITPEASYLVFLDCRKLNMDENQMDDFFVNKAHIVLNDGFRFGEPGRGFMRMNVAVPRPVLLKAINQLKDAYNSLD